MTKRGKNKNIETISIIIMFTMLSFSVKAGINRETPRAKVTFAHTITAINPEYANKEMSVICGTMLNEITMIATAMGVAISQPWINLAKISLFTPDGAFR